jgi:UDP-GlcNAc:undecaprenyl-phosphate GlcNAc-1-phosphate transferase
MFLCALLASAAATPLARSLALALGAVSRPGGRNINSRAIPRLGGIAVAFGVLLPLVGVFFAHHSTVAAALREERVRLPALLIGSLTVCILGFLDDVRRVRPLHKLCVQVLAASFVFALGFRIEGVQVPLVGPVSMGIFAGPVTVFWIVSVTNAINLIDGLDGLAGGVVFFAGVVNFVVASMCNGLMVGAIMAAMLGAVLGFLIFNFNPARIFMGDSGSYFLGFLLGTSSLAGASQKASTVVAIFVPLLALGLPIVDMLLTIVRRVLQRRSPFSADRGHIHHRLLDMGLTHRRAVFLLYGVCFVFACAAITVSLGRIWIVGIALLVSSAVIMAIVRFVGYFEYVLLLRTQRAKLRAPHTEGLRHGVPEALIRLRQAGDEREVWEALEAFVKDARLRSAELCKIEKVDDGPEGEAVPWSTHGRTSLDGGEESFLVVARYAIGPESRARANLSFSWNGDMNDVLPQDDILMQLVVDAATQALERVYSPYAPRAAAKTSGLLGEEPSPAALSSVGTR